MFVSFVNFLFSANKKREVLTVFKCAQSESQYVCFFSVYSKIKNKKREVLSVVNQNSID